LSYGCFSKENKFYFLITNQKFHLVIFEAIDAPHLLFYVKEGIFFVVVKKIHGIKLK